MSPNETRPLPNAADKAALKAIATSIVQTCPSLQDAAHEVAADLLKKYGITGLDPDRVYFHRFDAAQSSSKAFTGWEHVNATPTSTLTLTQLVIHRFRVADQDNADLLDVYAGFYTAGPNAGTFNETNEVRLHGNDVLKDFWSIDFSSRYNERLTAFWKDSGDNFRTLAKCNFLIEAVRARDKRQLSDEDFRFVTQAAVGPLTWPLSLQFLQSKATGADCVRTLDVGGYIATNILRFVAPKGRQILYLPGETDAFQVLETATDMHFWMLVKMNKKEVRQGFMAHFPLAERQEIEDSITDLMNRLVSTWGHYDHHLINQANQVIAGDVFSWLQTSTESAMFAEAALALTSNADLRKKLWIGYLSAGVKVFAPMAVIGWPVALPVIGASIASMGLNIDQAVNGKNSEERKAGILGAVLSGIDMLFNVLVLKGPGSLEEIGPEIDAAEAEEVAELKEATQPATDTEPTPVEPTDNTGATIDVTEIEDPELRAWALGGADDLEPTPGTSDTSGVTSRFDSSQQVQRDTLIRDARAWYQANPLSPRLPFVSSAPVESPGELFDAAFTEKPGLVIGESRGSIGSKQFLIENMPALAQRGVKTLYVQELLVNVNQSGLDTFARTGEMPTELEHYLQKLDFMAGNDPDNRFTLTQLVKTAQTQRIRVQALDTSTTYNINRAPFGSEPDAPMTRRFLASQIIRLNQQMKAPAKWVALVDREHMTTFRGYQGIAEQSDALSIRIDDVAPGQAAPISADPGVMVEYSDYPGSAVYDAVESTPDFDAIHAQIQGNWRVQMETPWAYRTAQELRALLPEPGMFTFQRYRNSVLVVYRDNAHRMADSVIRTTPGGRINLDTPMRPAYDSMTVDSLDELKQALVEKGLRPMGWPPTSLSGERSPAPTGSGLATLDNWQANEVLDGMTPVTEPGKFRGIYRLDSNPSTAILLDEKAFYVRYESDANGAGTWAIIDPQNPNAFSGSLPVRLNENGEWELAPRGDLKGGGNDVGSLSTSAAEHSAPITLRFPLTRYDAPKRYSLRKLALGIRETHIKLMRLPDGTMKGITTYDEHVAALRLALSRDANTFFTRTDLFASLPARPAMPVVTPATTAPELIERILNQAPGLVVGESQDRIASMRFLIENMPVLSRHGVRTLYFHRLLNDFSQVDLNAFASTGTMSDDLEAFLQQLQSDPSGRYTPLEVVRAARLNGVRVQATDCLASYRYPGPPYPERQEQTIKNYLTHTIMQANESINDSGKWVVLTDQENINTFRGMPGISELHGGVGLRIEEIQPQDSLLIEMDRGIEVGRGYSNLPSTPSGNLETLYADLSLQMPMPPIERTEQALERLLLRQGMFTFEKSAETWTLIHRGRDNRIARTLVERTLDGHYLINRPSWTDIHQVHYPTVAEMSGALSRMGMALEGRLPL
ncbi:dermonecrotic toxin domain-containing protein [Pseudomonas sp. NPDC089569]|uniref:membrane-targeted effector domain-containing toxin n=1 Tax=Pseudomonas sp. NPDC089569 TaxID=3390722 RepID=UPI003D03B13C